MEAAILAALGNVFGGVFNSIGNALNIKALQQQNINDQQTAETYEFNSIFGYKTNVTAAEAQKIRTGMIAVALMAVVLIIAIALTSRNKKTNATNRPTNTGSNKQL